MLNTISRSALIVPVEEQRRYPVQADGYLNPLDYWVCRILRIGVDTREDSDDPVSMRSTLPVHSLRRNVLGMGGAVMVLASE